MYSFLQEELFPLADVARTRLEQRFQLRHATVEKAFDDSISFAPTFHWKKGFHIFVCEVSERPFPKHIKELFSDLIVSEIPSRVFVAYPEANQLSANEMHLDLKKARDFGLGLVSIDQGGGTTIIQSGISVPLLPRKLELEIYSNSLRPLIEDAYNLYLTADPKHGIQELGQIIERITRNIAVDAKKKGKLKKGADPNNPKTAHGNVLDIMVDEKIIDTAVLGRCRAFVVDRNDSSHKPRNLREALAIERNLKDNFNTGLRILQDLPKALKAKGFSLKVMG